MLRAGGAGRDAPLTRTVPLPAPCPLQPTAFYAALSWRRQGWAARAGLVALLALGEALVGLVTAMSIHDMRRQHPGGGGGSTLGSIGLLGLAQG